MRRLRPRFLALAAVAALLTVPGPVSATPSETTAPALIPRPVSQQVLAGETFELDRHSRIGIDSWRTYRIADSLARQLRRSTGFRLPVTHSHRADISLSTNGPSSLGAEGYRLRVTDHRVSLVAHTPEGLFRAVTTLRQLLPAKADASTRQPGPWQIAGTSIADSPRYAYRGTMLDVSRHFFSVAEVKRYIDLASRYKLNKLHLHLADDQGWRITVDSWPRLTTYGGSLEVGGTPGGWHTRRDFAEIVRYAAEHFMTVIPEIDTPGHTNAALASYAELNCNGVAPPLYTGTAVGFSSLCTTKEITYEFLDDVFREVSRQAPGPLLHLGGDEAHVTPHEEYLRFVPRASALVNKHGKRVMGWQEIAETPLPAGSVAQYWGTDDERSRRLARAAAAQGAQVVLSPANRIYLDMKYDRSTPYGLSWAGFVNVQKSYSWNPSTLVPDLPESAVAGVEAPVWSETLDEIAKVEFMAFPRLAGVSELGWSPAAALNWDDYRDRLGGQGARWDVLGVNFFRAPEIPWR